MPLSHSDSAHRKAGLVYCLWLLGFLFGITAIIGVIINHKYLSDVKGTHAHSHFLWQIGSFWIVFSGAVISAILWPAPIAKVISIGSFMIWLFSGLIGSWLLSRYRKIRFLSSIDRNQQPLRQERTDPPLELNTGAASADLKPRY